MRLRRHFVDEGVCGGAEASIRREGDGLELDVEVFVVNDLATVRPSPPPLRPAQIAEIMHFPLSCRACGRSSRNPYR